MQVKISQLRALIQESFKNILEKSDVGVTKGDPMAGGDFSMSIDDLVNMPSSDFEKLKKSVSKVDKDAPPVFPTGPTNPDDNWSVGVWDPQASDADRTDASQTMQMKLDRDRLKKSQQRNAGTKVHSTLSTPSTTNEPTNIGRK